MHIDIDEHTTNGRKRANQPQPTPLNPNVSNTRHEAKCTIESGAVAIDVYLEREVAPATAHVRRCSSMDLSRSGTHNAGGWREMGGGGGMHVGKQRVSH